MLTTRHILLRMLKELREEAIRRKLAGIHDNYEASFLHGKLSPVYVPEVFRQLKLDLHRPIIEQLEEAALESGDEATLKWLETYIWKRPGIGLRFDPDSLMRTLSRKKRRRAESR